MKISDNDFKELIKTAIKVQDDCWIQTKYLKVSGSAGYQIAVSYTHLDVYKRQFWCTRL